MLMLDRVVELEPRRFARGIKCVSYNEPLLQAYSPANPQLPPALCMEALSQLLTVLVYASDGIMPARQDFLLAGAEKIKFRRAIYPGDSMRISITVLQQRANIWKCAGEIEVDDAVCMEGEVLAAIQGRNGD